ncbi:hypothetical protein NE237_030450 [Protea cynaroides]|uniref:DNA helicase n=1 Tax=Protea cynaroides TaxID=273540 RepID=A0A9Q0GVY8_9MAGN|nr:hypothetical protein NE237_030450 [Protea cynaroides]
MDEVNVVPAHMFCKVNSITKSHCKFGLTATETYGATSHQERTRVLYAFKHRSEVMFLGLLFLKERHYSTRRRQFLIDEGYSFKVLNAGDDAIGLEQLKDADDFALKKACQSVGSMTAVISSSTPMATNAQGLTQDQNFSDHFEGPFVGGGQNASRAHNKLKLGSRKALTDVTNSGKLSLDQATKKNDSKNWSSTGGGSCTVAKPFVSVGRKALTDVTNSGEPSRHLATKKDSKRLSFTGGSSNVSKHLSSIGIKTNPSKYQEKSGIGGRKELSDIVISGKPCLRQALKKTCAKNLNAIAEEQCLHDHQQCINSHRRAMDIDFLSMMTPGLDNVEIASPGGLSLLKQSKADSPPRYLELKEIPGLLDECLSPLQCWSWAPKSPKTSICWTAHPSPNLMLKGTPELCSDITKKVYRDQQI